MILCTVPMVRLVGVHNEMVSVQRNHGDGEGGGEGEEEREEGGEGAQCWIQRQLPVLREYLYAE